ncbi:acyltransferase domain-containing protein [Streptomyces sp. bgisy032]|uniref:acyltransferase domain-containing protein n=1 Tax=Streptomyces sp. bgisy032 TaxID=3413773 RepID=UPI003D75C7AD
MPDTAGRARPVVLMFAGQGAQHPRMAAGLYGREETFTSWMDEAFRLLGPDGARLRKHWLVPEPPPVYDDVTVAQPLLYAVGHALGRLLLDRGVRPAALFGHSVGELVAATLAGVLGFADGMRLMRDRMALFADTPPGGMLAVAASVDEVKDVLGTRVHLAAVNAARQLLLAGERAALDETARLLGARGLVCRDVLARQAFHSPVVAEAVQASLPVWRDVPLAAPRRPLYSAYTGGPLDPERARDPEFWARQPAETVHFAPTLRAVLDDRPGCLLVEAGPGNSLSALARRQRAVTTGGGTVVPLLPDRCRGDDADIRSVERALRLLAERAAPGGTAADPPPPPGPPPSGPAPIRHAATGRTP